MYENILSYPLGNPHSRGPAGRKTSSIIDDARARVLSHFGTTSEEYDIIFTSGATSSLKIIGEIFPWSIDSTFSYSVNSHTSVLGIRSFAQKAYAISSHHFINFRKDSVYIQKAPADSFEDITYHLFIAPGECNFSGSKYDIPSLGQFASEVSPDWLQANASVVKDETITRGITPLDRIHRTLWCLDASKLAGTSKVDLSKIAAHCQPDFVVMSFYKMFGYPTGLGALMVKKRKIMPFNPYLAMQAS